MDAADAALVVDAGAPEASAVNRLLAERGVFAAEVSIRRPSLEAVFRELTIDHADVATPPADADAVLA